MDNNGVIAVQQFVNRLWTGLDRRDYSFVLSVLAPDCRWLREGWVEGHDAIARSLDLRPPTVVVRHVVTNLVVDPHADGWLATYLVMAFIGSRPSGSDALLPSRPPALMANLRMTLAGPSDRLLVTEIEPTIVFKDMTISEAGRLPSAPDGTPHQ